MFKKAFLSTFLSRINQSSFAVRSYKIKDKLTKVHDINSNKIIIFRMFVIRIWVLFNNIFGVAISITVYFTYKWLYNVQ